jgi:hypothetical protein
MSFSFIQSTPSPRRRSYKRKPTAYQQPTAKAYTPPQQGRKIPMGGSRITTGPAQPQQGEQGTGGLLETFGAVKEGYDQTVEAKAKGAAAKKWFDSPERIGGISPRESMQDSLSGFQDFFTGNNTFNNAEQAGAINSVANDVLGRGGADRLTGMGGLSNPLRGQAFSQGVGGGAGLIPPGNPGIGAFNPPPSGMAPLTSSQQMFAPGNMGQLGTAEQSLSQLNNATTMGKEASLAANAGKMGNMGAFMSAAGIGLNAYDMTQNGINPGNAMGLAGSAVMLGTMNAWNPFGWALLAGSAAYSLFG